MAQQIYGTEATASTTAAVYSLLAQHRTHFKMSSRMPVSFSPRSKAEVAAVKAEEVAERRVRLGAHCAFYCIPRLICWRFSVSGLAAFQQILVSIAFSLSSVLHKRGVLRYNRLGHSGFNMFAHMAVNRPRQLSVIEASVRCCCIVREDSMSSISSMVMDCAVVEPTRSRGLPGAFERVPSKGEGRM
jgi:hypothetical protein